MEKNIKTALLKAIGKLYESSNACELKPKYFKAADRELTCLSNYFNLSKTQSFFVAIFISFEQNTDRIQFSDLSGHFMCNPMRLLEFTDDIEALQAKGILRRKQVNQRGRLFSTNGLTSNYYYSVNDKITAAILKSEPMPEIEEEVLTDVFQLLDKVHKLAQYRDREEISTEELLVNVRELISSGARFPLIEKTARYQLDDMDACLFLCTVWDCLTGCETTDFIHFTRQVFDNASKKYLYIQKMNLNKNKLVVREHLEVIPGNFRDDTHLKLTDKTIRMLKELGINVLTDNKKKNDNVIEPASIVTKPLYFNDLEQNQLNMVKKLLAEENFKEIQLRLERQGMPRGITALLHGAPGTGKTETVLQVAKATNREIVKTDISATKSMWFGESEKKIKRIFTDYADYAADCERTPILLFNEADAIISKRSSHGDSNVSQTQNTIQNVILEALENFDGIFFATTNLVGNLDAAFERRFLFKIEFQKPGVPVKTRIWHSKLPDLSEAECTTLAHRFDLSGGQIENIIRKNQIHEILHGVPVDFDTILNFCNTELISKTAGTRIGFTKA